MVDPHHVGDGRRCSPTSGRSSPGPTAATACRRRRTRRTGLGLETLLAPRPRSPPEARLRTRRRVRRDPDAPIAVGLGREGLLFVDAYTGAVLGEGSRRVARLLPVGDGLAPLARRVRRGPRGRARRHRRLQPRLPLPRLERLLPLVAARAGRGASAAVIVVPARPARAGRATSTGTTWPASGRRCPSSSWCSSAVLFSYPWANDLLYRVTGSEPPPRRTSPPRGTWRPRPTRARPGRVGCPLPEGRGDGRRLADHQLPASHLRRRERHVLHRRGRRRTSRPARAARTRSPDGRDRPLEPYESQSLGRRLRSWARWLHTGEAGGLPGQTVAAMASAGGALLVWTGLSMAWRRFSAWKRQKTRARQGPGSVRQREEAA